MKTLNDRLVERFSASTLLFMARTLCVVVFVLNVATMVAIVIASVTLYPFSHGWSTAGLIIMSLMAGLDTLANMIKGATFFIKLPFKVLMLYAQRNTIRPLEPA